MDFFRIGRFALAGAVLLTLGVPAQARPLVTELSLPDNIGFPMPNMGGGYLTLPIPLPGGGSFPIGIPMPGQGYQSGYQGGYPGGGGFTLPIPLPGGGSLPIPISFPGQPDPYQGQGGYYQGGYAPTQTGYQQPPQGGYFPGQGGYAPQQQPTDGRVMGYETITYQGHPCAVNRQDLPLAVYSEDPGMKFVLDQAASTWNEAGQKMGGIKFVEVVDRPTTGAIGVDWTGRGMPQGAAGLTTMMKSRAGVRVTGIGLKPMRGAPERKMVEVLSHELGHALGLDHSEDQGDLMYRSTRPQSQRGQMLSGRDLQMLQWLYTQQDAVPIVAAR